MTDALRPLVYVRWQDASHPLGHWQSVARAKRRPMLTETCGFLVLDLPDQIIVASTVDRSDGRHHTYTGEICIPRRCVLSMTPISCPETPRSGDE
jgi:hypothetical protein